MPKVDIRRKRSEDGWKAESRAALCGRQLRSAQRSTLLFRYENITRRPAAGSQMPEPSPVI